jgi:GxxExxY protein
MTEAPNIVYKEESYRILGACFAVYNEKGCGFLEPVVHECLEIEFDHEGIPFRSKPPLTLTYRGRTLTQTFQPDFVCFDKILLEIKAVAALADEHRAQILNYLSATDYELGLLVNFGHYPRVQHERFLRGEKLRPGSERAVRREEDLCL